MKNNNYQRGTGKQKYIETILIVCEGKTENQYFKALRKICKLRQVTIANHDNTSHPCGVVEVAQDKIKKMKDPCDHVYCVVDVDCHQNLSKAQKLVAQHNKNTKKSKITLITSNPCFEYWILLHYENTNKLYGAHPSPCNAVTQDLKKKHINDYKKNYDKFKEVIAKNLNKALVNSKQHQRPVGSSSYTEVYQVVEKMLEIQEQLKARFKNTYHCSP